MKRRILEFPVGPESLASDALPGVTGLDIDSERTLNWLVQQRTEAAAIDAIRDAWRASRFPLSQWADAIERVLPWELPEAHSVGIDVRLRSPVARRVLQAAPVSASELLEHTSRSGVRLPSSLADLVCAAPRASVNGTGELISLKCVRDPMGYVRGWLDARAVTPEACAAEGYEYPDFGAFVVEFAFDGMGNCLVCGVDGCTHFFDHEESPNLLPCDIRIEELLQRYFEDPSVICDDAMLGIRSMPKPEWTSLSLPEVLAESCVQLTTWGNLALAVRCCERADPTRHTDSLPVQWHGHAHDLREVVDLCRAASVSGRALDVSDLRPAKARSRLSYDVWRQVRQDPYDVRYLGGSYALAIGRLVDACGNPEDYETAKEVAMRCGHMTIWMGMDLPAWQRAVVADVTLLLQQDLGTSGSIGRPVPAWFFARE